MKNRAVIIILFAGLIAIVIHFVYKVKELKEEIAEMQEYQLALMSQSAYRESLINKFEEENNALRSKVVQQPGSNTLQSTDIINTRINGDFQGWSGGTVFSMADGTIWQQAEHNVYYFTAYMPAVQIINKNGEYFMRVSNADRELKVKRIK